MSEFWYTSQTMRALKGETYRSFELLSPTHLFWLAMTLLAVIWAFTWFRKQDEKTKTKAYRILTALLLADEIFKYVVTLATGQFEWQFLPFHLCSINLFVCLWHTLRPNTTAKEILYTICIPAALIALLTPAWMPLARCRSSRSGACWRSRSLTRRRRWRRGARPTTACSISMPRPTTPGGR